PRGRRARHREREDDRHRRPADPGASRPRAQDRHRAVMRAAVLRAAGQPVTIEEVRVRDPGPGEVRVAIRAAGLCHSDLSVIDARVPFDRAALIGCGIMTGVGAVLNRARVEAGAAMAVFGLGGIGLSCVQGGVLAGAARIIAVDVVPAKLELARRLGATHAIDAAKDDPVPAVRDLTHGGADYTFEAVGSLTVIRQALDALGAGGALTVVGV